MPAPHEQALRAKSLRKPFLDLLRFRPPDPLQVQDRAGQHLESTPEHAARRADAGLVLVEALRRRIAADADRMDRIIAEARTTREAREKTYRERALKLFPWVCARCSREFEGKKLRELTVHHKDHNHDNNPPDGSNWELLCLYCHDNEHQRQLDERAIVAGQSERGAHSTHAPFADLASLLKKDA